MMHELGLPLKLMEWIMVCVTSVTYFVLLNGQPLPPFSAKKGLRQGDPLSPYLFTMAMECLSRCLARLGDNASFGFHPKCKRTRTIALLFADDLLIFSKAIHPLLGSLRSNLRSFLHPQAFKLTRKNLLCIRVV